MNLQFYLEKLQNHDGFGKFKKENSKSYLCSAFLSIDKEKNNNQIHFDFFIPKKKKITSFQMNDEIKIVPLEKYDDKIPEEIFNINIDFNELENLISEKMERENIKNKIQKIILSLQNFHGKEILSGTIFISMLGMIKIVIELKDKKITEFEKKSLLDMVKIFKKRE